MGATGMEMMLKAAGLGDVVKMAQKLADEKTLDKILAFGDGMQKMQATLADIQEVLRGSGSTFVSCPDCPYRKPAPEFARLPEYNGSDRRS